MQEPLKSTRPRSRAQIVRGLVIVGVGLFMTFGNAVFYGQVGAMTGKVGKETAEGIDPPEGELDPPESQLELPESQPDGNVYHPPISDYLALEIEKQGGAALPILVPFEMSANEEAVRVFKFKIRLTKDGYTAVMSDGERDIVINGALGTGSSSGNHSSSSNHSGGETSGFGGESTEEESHFEAGPIASRLDYVQDYEDFDDGRGGSVSFGFRSCDYQIEFYCRDLLEVDGPNCIEATEALELVEGLVSG